MHSTGKLAERHSVLLGDGQFGQEISRVHVHDRSPDDLSSAFAGEDLGESLRLAVTDRYPFHVIVL
jgi:hypothetical protein